MNKEAELLSFIETKRLFINNCDIDWENVYLLYTRALKLTISKINIIVPDKNLLRTSIEVIHNIFWIIYLYTQNIKLSMFLCERSTILLTEYISLSDDINIISENSDINVLDIKLFLYKKTVGPLNLFSNNKIVNNENVAVLSKIVTNILIDIITFKFEISNIQEFIKTFFSIFNNIFYKMAYIGKNDVIENIIMKFSDINNEKDLINDLNLKKIKLEIYYYIYINFKNEFTNLYSQVISNISDLDLYDYFNKTAVDSEKDYFNKIVKIIDNINCKYDQLNN